MNILEALALASTGKKVRGISTGALLTGLDGYTLAQLQDSFEEIPEASVSVTKGKLIAAWNSARPSSGSVGAAESSSMFTRFCAALGVEG
jgi:hypothetical protein